MKLEEQFKYLVGGYFGVELLDEYDLKVYLLKDIEKYIIDFFNANSLKKLNYMKKAMEIKEELSEKEKLQDALLVLNMIEAPMDVIFLIKKKLKTMNSKNNKTI